jgi:hypothetical protein
MGDMFPPHRLPYVIGVWALGGSFHLIGTFLTIGTYDMFFHSCGWANK